VLQEQYKEKIANDLHIHDSVPLAQIERDAPESLAQCLDGLVKNEDITCFCRECTKNADGEFTETEHSKSMELHGCPPLLLLQLKRFRSEENGLSYKLHNLISFPMDLDLKSYLSADDSVPVVMESGASGFKTLSRSGCSYSLYAVVNHIGGGMGGGHYTASVRRHDKWYSCNDSFITPIAEEDVVTSNGYLLFYARQDVLDKTTGLHQIFPARKDSECSAVDPEHVKRLPWSRQGTGNDHMPPALYGADRPSHCCVM